MTSFAKQGSKHLPDEVSVSVTRDSGWENAVIIHVAVQM